MKDTDRISGISRATQHASVKIDLETGLFMELLYVEDPVNISSPIRSDPPEVDYSGCSRPLA
jgi:hypothetical protein